MKFKNAISYFNAWIKSDYGIISILLLAALILMLFSGCTEHSLAFAVIVGTSQGKQILGAPLTTDITRKESDILLNEIDQHIVKIRPMATPIDQISRWAGAKRTGSMVVDYYSVDTKSTISSVKEDYEEPTATGITQAATRCVLKTKNDEIFEVSETILVKGVPGYAEDGLTSTENDLVLYVLSKNAENHLTVMAVNGKKIGIIENCVPSIDTGTPLIRMGRAATELDVQTSQFESLPVKAQNFCQIFKMQIEQSTLQKIANKEVDWSFSDQEEAAIYDMRLGMEKNFLFGAKRRIYDTVKKEDVMLTGGIWFQAGKNFSYSASEFNQDLVIEMIKKAFTGNAGNKRKVLIGGSNLIGRLNKLESTKIVAAGDNIVKWGIDFSEIRSKFGKLYVLLSEVFDDCNMSDCGIIIDPEYLQKYSHVPFNSLPIDMKAAGIRNTDALVLTEASCLTLRYPDAHMRIEMK